MRTQWVFDPIRIFPSNRWSFCVCKKLKQTQRHSSLYTFGPEKPYYVTTPIFYVNAGWKYLFNSAVLCWTWLIFVIAPHVGHLYSLVLADIFKRWAVLRGKKAILSTGTDEHGMKVQRAASHQGQDVRAFCDQNSKAFNTLAKMAEINQDYFIRTSEPDHKAAVQHFWLMLKERGFIYASKHEGWYSISDETFYPATSVQLALDPSTGRKFMASIETGKEVEWTSEDNYHFRISALKDRLLDFYFKNPDFVVPSTRMKEVVVQVQSGLQDLSISRPVERLSWGIPVPDDESQVIYVWMDALINYLTNAKYPFQAPGQEHAAGWPADLHVVGKDILRFHSIYWPAFLMALDLPLPRQILAHAHWTLGGEKMSKSLGNVVDPFFAIERFGVDGLRYFLAYNGGIKDDAMYDNSLIIDQYTKHLQGSLGNLASRIVRGKGWNIRRAVQQHEVSNAGLAKTLITSLEGLQALSARLLDEQLDTRNPLVAIMKNIKMTNSYMSSASPWDFASSLSPNLMELDRIIYLCAESLRICGILLQPYMPSKMKTLLDLLGVANDARTFEYATLGADCNYGTASIPVGRGHTGVLFPHLRSTL